MPRKKSLITNTDPLWYKDAVIYQLHVKSFFDSDNDGIGDFAGLLQKLDYITELGVTCIWLLPFYPSPRRDDGYDIADYRNVHPEYGKTRDFKRFVEEAHARGLRVVTELVINHTSDQHPWFQKARRAKPGSAARDFYVWSDDDKKYSGTRIIFLDTEKSNWTWDPVANQYFWHRFYSHQPDLNFDNPKVLKEVFSIMRFWLDMGVDGLRLDAVPYLVEREGTNNENLPETHAILKKIRAELDATYPDRMLLAEANQWPEDTQDYFGQGDECHMAFHFPLMPRMYMAIAQEDRFPITDIMRQTPEIPENCQWAVFLRNHDELTLEMVTDKERDYLWNTYASETRARINLGIRRRLAPLLQRDRRRIELMNSLLLTMPGTPVIYYGDEIGMGDNIFLGDRDGVRTPMQWSPDRNGGFSRADPARLTLPPIQDPLYGYDRVNVESQERDASSLLNWTRRMLAVRKQHAAFGRGTIRFLRPANRKILAYLREHGDDTILCVANVSRQAQAVELNLGEFAGRIPVELSGGASFPQVGQLPYLLTLPPYGFFWFQLSETVEPPQWSTATAGIEPEHLTFVVRRGVEEVIEGKSRETLERDVLPSYAPHRRWFQRKDQAIEKVELVTAMPLPGSGKDILMSLVEITTTSGPERYALPLAISWDDEPPAPFAPQLAMARVRMGRRVGYLTDGFAMPGFARALTHGLAEGSVLPTQTGEIRFNATTHFAEHAPAEDAEIEWLTAEQSNSTLIVGRQAVFKLLRKLTAGIHPEAEMSRYLTENGFANSPPLLGEVVHVARDGTPTTLALVQGFVLNQGDGWQWTLNYLDRTIDELSTHSEEEIAENGHEFETYHAFARNLGHRLAEMHGVLGRETAADDFRPETAGGEDVARLRDGVRSQLEAAFAAIEAYGEWDHEEDAAQARTVLDSRERLLALVDEKAQAIAGTPRIRIHGDLHLGQLLVAGNDVMIIDFEGEPAKSLADRRAKASPLRDVAGVIRSFDYAASNLKKHRHTPQGPLTEARGAQLRSLFRQVAEEAFLEGYREVAPEGVSNSSLLDLFILEKAAYEICYEAANRPAWLDVPLNGFAHVAERLLASNEEMS
ncbi:maltose alpha-D-glucosyltransferase [Salinarimonas sp.]|uniref:maltose alpha-D-glucosyltransferase n=1 Tax=Salinarimonas sp. TaxID=2766526 RepID=UPI0032D8F599